MKAKYLTLFFLKVPKIKLTKKESQRNIKFNNIKCSIAVIKWMSDKNLHIWTVLKFKADGF